MLKSPILSIPELKIIDSVNFSFPGTPLMNQMIVYDAGDKHLKCYRITTTTGLLLIWKVKVKNFIAMTTDINKLAELSDTENQRDEDSTDKPYLIILTKSGLIIMDFSGNSIQNIDSKWKGVARDVSVYDNMIALSEGKGVLVYTSKYKEVDCMHGFDNVNYVV